MKKKILGVLIISMLFSVVFAPMNLYAIEFVSGYMDDSISYSKIEAHEDYANEDNDYLLGDVDGNGVINANDAAIVLDLYKYNDISEEDLKIADIDGNGIVNANDAALILDMYKYGD